MQSGLYVLSTPESRSHVVTITGGEVVTGRNFGNIQDQLVITAPTASPGTINEGGSTTVSGTFTDPDAGNDEPHTVTITWGDGSPATVLNLPGGVSSFTASHTYADDNPTGTSSDVNTIEATVTDATANSVSGSTSVLVNNVAPAPTITGAPASSTEGTTITLGRTANDPGTDTFQDTWQVFKNGVSYASGTGPTFSFTPDDNGSYTVMLTTRDDDQGVGGAVASIAVANVAPVVGIAGVPATSPEGTAITLVGAVSDPGTADTQTYSWSVAASNGQVIGGGSAPTFTFTPNENGTYTVSLTVADDDGAAGSASAAILVINVAPSNVQLNPSRTSIVESETITLDGAFLDPGTLDTHTVVINWGDGSPVTTLNLALGARGFGGASHQYRDNRPGDAPYTITATVTDDDGGSGSGSTDVTVRNVAPSNVMLTRSGTSINESGSITLGGSFVDLGPLDSHTVVITWDDGSPVTTLTLPAGTLSFAGVGHQYRDNQTDTGLNSIIATVTDKDGAIAGTGTFVVVSNVAPTLTISGAGSVNPGVAAYTLNVAASDPGTDTIAFWTINWGDGSIETFAGNPSAVTHVYGRCASYTISATATDEDGTFSAGNTVTVVAQFPTANECFLAGVYVDILGRPIDSTGLAVWTGHLNQGATRDQVTQAIALSTEGRTRQVEGYYQRFLGRAADPDGLNLFVSALRNGTMRAEDVIATIVGSPESFARAGGANDAFLARAYLDLLGRQIDETGRAVWTAQLGQGASRSQVVRSIEGTDEGGRSTVQRFYRQFLNRDADSFGLNLFAEALRQGATQEQVIGAIVGSPEYLQRNT
jgi:hypothetical protein